MYETAEDMIALSELLDRSYARAGEHLRGIFTPERRIPADELVALLPGVQVLNLATVTRACEPRVAPVDGLFYRGKLWFGTASAAVRIRHLRERPQVSASETRGEEFACARTDSKCTAPSVIGLISTSVAEPPTGVAGPVNSESSLGKTTIFSCGVRDR
jgi:hypothetical protein